MGSYVSSSSNVIRFDRHRHGEFTNEAAYGIRLAGQTWPTVQHYLLARQYVLSHDDMIRHESVEELENLIRERRLQSHPKWEVYRDEHLLRALQAKFSQHLDLEASLIQTDDALLVYASHGDTYLGIGKEGDGHNMLGRMLMRVRNKIGQSTPGGSQPPDDTEQVDCASVVVQQVECPDRLADLATTYINCGHYHRALEAAYRAVQNDPDHETAYSLLAWCLLTLQEYEEAVNVLKVCVRRNPADPIFHWWLSIAYEELGKSIPAIVSAQRARRLEGGP